MNTFALAMLVTVVSTQPHTHEGEEATADFEVASLAKNLDDAVKVCSSMIVSTANKSASYRPEQLARQNGRLHDIAVPDAGMLSLINPKFGPAKFANWLDPHAIIVMMNYRNTPYCRIFVEGAQWVNRIRPSLERLVQVGDFWRIEQFGQQTSAGERSVFKAKLQASGAILTITGFDSTKGTIGVALSAEPHIKP
jgi:hypothetical protein